MATTSPAKLYGSLPMQERTLLRHLAKDPKHYGFRIANDGAGPCDYYAYNHNGEAFMVITYYKGRKLVSHGIGSFVGAFKREALEAEARAAGIEGNIRDTASRTLREEIARRGKTVPENIFGRTPSVMMGSIHGPWPVIPLLVGCCVRCGRQPTITPSQVNETPFIRVEATCSCNAGLHLWPDRVTSTIILADKPMSPQELEPPDYVPLSFK